MPRLTDAGPDNPRPMLGVDYRATILPVSSFVESKDRFGNIWFHLRSTRAIEIRVHACVFVKDMSCMPWSDLSRSLTQLVAIQAVLWISLKGKSSCVGSLNPSCAFLRFSGQSVL